MCLEVQKYSVCYLNPLAMWIDSHFFVVYVKIKGMPGEEGPRGPRALDGCNGTDGMQGTPGYAGSPGKLIALWKKTETCSSYILI